MPEVGGQRFTPAQVLAVIGVCAVVATTVALVTRGSSGGNDAGAFAAEAATIRAAQETYCERHGVYGSEPDLIEAGLLRGRLSLHEVVVEGSADCGAGDPAASRYTATCDVGESGCGAGGALPKGAGYWGSTGPLVVGGRSHNTATLLDDGTVLAAAGTAKRESLRSAEIYDPLSETWALVGALNEARWHHTATRLQDGRVLVVGGFEKYGPEGNLSVLDTAELYEPATRTWTRTGSLGTRRALHAAALLSDGKVLVAGGRTCENEPPWLCGPEEATATSEVYDPSTGLWTPTKGPMGRYRYGTNAVALRDGRVMVTAGFTGPPTVDGARSDAAASEDADPNTTTEIYDQANGTWAPAALNGRLSLGRSGAGVMALADGRVLVAAGRGGANTAEVYDSAADAWTLTGIVSAPERSGYWWRVLEDARVLIAGGTGPTAGRSAELYDPTTGRWASAGLMRTDHGTGAFGRSAEAVVLSSDPSTFAADPAVCGNHCGKVLIFGGNSSAAAELYDPRG